MEGHTIDASVNGYDSFKFNYCKATPRKKTQLSNCEKTRRQFSQKAHDTCIASVACLRWIKVQKP